MELPNVVVDADTTESLCRGAAKVAIAVRPMWVNKRFIFKVYTDGITNKLVGVWPEEEDRREQLLVRVYGDKTELFIDRCLEKRNIALLHKYGCAPELYCSFSNGLCYGYTPGTPLDTVTVRQEEIWSATARHMAELHSIAIDSSEPELFQKLKHFIALLPDFSLCEKLRKAAIKGISKDFLLSEMATLQQEVDALDCPVTLCHNDLLLANIIWHSESKQLRFIDFEYTAPNYQAFDIANHFCEFAGVDTIDYNRYPDEAFRKQWIERYLSHLSTPSSLPVSWWQGAVAVFSLCSHLLWATWSLLQAVHSNINFDFSGYSVERIEEYRRRKSEFIATVAAVQAEAVSNHCDSTEN